MAWRNIWRNRTRSIVIMLSVAIGMLAGTVVLALYKGMMQGRVRTVIDTETAHLQLHHPAFSKDYHPSFVLPETDRFLSTLPGIIHVSHRSIVQGMLVTPTGSAGVEIYGIIPEQENPVSALDRKITAGKSFSSGNSHEIIVGKKLAGKMKLKTGSKLVLTFTDSSNYLVSAAFRVCGLYQSANAPRDELMVYTPKAVLNELLLTGNSCHETAILLQHDERLDSVQTALKKAFPSLLVENWKEITPETELMVKTVDEYSYIIMAIILFALAFGVLNTMLMSVLERTREIGMMMALGTSGTRIFLLILAETLILTIAGTPAGLAAAYFITGYFGKYGLDLSGMGEDMMASFGYSTMIYPSFPGEKLSGIVIMIAATAVLSALLPALKALRMQPVDSLRR